MADNKIQGEKKRTYNRTMKYLGIFGGAQVISMFFDLLRNKFASVLLGAGGLGIVALYNRTIQMFSACTNLSLSFSAVRSLSEAFETGDDKVVRHCVKVVRSVALLTGIVGMLLFLAVSPLLSVWIFGASEYYVSRFLLLSPVLLFIAVSGGELAIMRGVRELSKVAVCMVWTALSALLVAVPLYMWMGLGGVFPVIFLIAFMQVAGLMFCSLRLYRYSVSPFSLRILKEGRGMVKLGAGYIFASILTSCALWLVLKAVSAFGDGAETGLFSAGYFFVSVLPGVLFSALDSDYYPRLSAIFNKTAERDALVNEHVEVHVLVQSPIILFVVTFMPLLLPLLYSADFMPAVKMAQLALLGLLCHTATYPVSFLPLSKGDTMLFVVQETIYNLTFTALIVAGYYFAGLTGAGVALLLTRIVDLAVVYAISRFKYGFRLSGRACAYLAVNALIFLLAGLAVFVCGSVLVATVVGGLCVLLSGAYSFYYLSKNSSVLPALKRRFLKFKR